MKNPFDSTVAALSTPPGKGGVALIRLSGPEAAPIADRVFRARSGKKVSSLPARTATYGDIFFEGDRIDDVLLTFFPAPHSYTGEDTVEITCHGGMLICRTILEALFAAGAMPAGRGEFTRRAFLAGHLGLSEAEAIGELLDAKSREQIRLYQKESRTRLRTTLTALYDTLSSLLSAIYAKIDYPDEDLAELDDAAIIEKLRSLSADISRLTATYRTGRAVAEGISTVLLGKPNTGKSSLYNLLCGKNAAIVTEYAGTTRDVLESSVSLGRVLLRLADTAGVRETTDPVEKIGVDRAKAAAEAAELILVLFDTSRPWDAEDETLLAYAETLPGEKIALLNKEDLPALWDAGRLAGHFVRVLPFSALQGDMQALTAAVDALFTDGSIRIGEDAVVSSARQYAALINAHEYVESTRNALESGVPYDAALSDLELAMQSLGETDGRSVSEDIVSGIFSKFCVGK